MEKNLKKLRVVKFIPTIVVQTKTIGQYIATSSCLYDDLLSARLALSSLVDIYSDYEDYNILRSSIIRKIIEL